MLARLACTLPRHPVRRLIRAARDQFGALVEAFRRWLGVGCGSRSRWKHEHESALTKEAGCYERNREARTSVSQFAFAGSRSAGPFNTTFRYFHAI